MDFHLLNVSGIHSEQVSMDSKFRWIASFEVADFPQSSVGEEDRVSAPNDEYLVASVISGVEEMGIMRTFD